MSKKDKKVIWRKKVNILGEIYDVQYRNRGKRFEAYHCDGFTSWDEKKIRVLNTYCPTYDKKNFRHEILHAFLFQSGLHNNTQVKRENQIHDEQMVDWCAIHFPALYKVFKELEVLD